MLESKAFKCQTAFECGLVTGAQARIEAQSSQACKSSLSTSGIAGPVLRSSESGIGVKEAIQAGEAIGSRVFSEFPFLSPLHIAPR